MRNLLIAWPGRTQIRKPWVSRNLMGLAGCNYKYSRRPPQGEGEKARRRRQIAKGMLRIGGA